MKGRKLKLVYIHDDNGDVGDGDCEYDDYDNTNNTNKTIITHRRQLKKEKKNKLIVFCCSKKTKSIDGEERK